MFDNLPIQADYPRSHYCDSQNESYCNNQHHVYFWNKKENYHLTNSLFSKRYITHHVTLQIKL